MATPRQVAVRILLPTFRRNLTLKRSIESLLLQTFTDWRCEVHNDDPDDPFPSSYVSALDDPRLSVQDHSTNLGPVRSFNLLYDNSEERYVTLLEDDNWWEPDFLETMHGVLEARPDIDIAWANMKLWQERPGNEWVDLNRTIWPRMQTEVTEFHFPEPRQIMSALHSNGAMLIRNSGLSRFKTPENIRFELIEAIRERSFPHPLLLVDRPLANFALTLSTGRENDLIGRYEQTVLLIDSFFSNSQASVHTPALWKLARQNKFRSFLVLIYAGIAFRSSRPLLKHPTFLEWSTFLLYNIKRPRTLFRCLNAKTDHAELWEYLSSHTAQRWRTGLTQNNTH